MASINRNHKSSSSTNNYYAKTEDVSARSNIQASAYSVNALTGALKGFHYSTSGAGGTSTIFQFDIESRRASTDTFIGVGWWV